MVKLEDSGNQLLIRIEMTNMKVLRMFRMCVLLDVVKCEKCLRVINIFQLHTVPGALLSLVRCYFIVRDELVWMEMQLIQNTEIDAWRGCL